MNIDRQEINKFSESLQPKKLFHHIIILSAILLTVVVLFLLINPTRPYYATDAEPSFYGKSCDLDEGINCGESTIAEIIACESLVGVTGGDCPPIPPQPGPPPEPPFNGGEPLEV